MSSFVERLINDDFVWVAITNSLTGKRKQSGTRFLNINCPMCVSRGETPDRKMRCGIKHDAKGLGIYCFNCGFKTIHKTGELLPRAMKEFMLAIGMSDMDVKRLNHKAMTYRSMLQTSPEAMLLLPDSFQPDFPSKSLPSGAKTFEEWATAGCSDPNFLEVAEYVFSRGDGIANATTYYWTPEPGGKHNFHRRVIIPFHFEGRIVGYTARTIDKTEKTRYTMNAPTNFLFNSRVLSIPERKYVILCEGVFDALAVDGIGLLGAHLNPQQIAWIKSYGKQVILVPDRDKRGSQMIDVALHNHWHVAFPQSREGDVGDHLNWWEPDVKDPADAVKRYGRLWTLLSIIETATDKHIEINVKRKRLF